MGAGRFQGTAQDDGKVLNHDTLGAGAPFGSRWFRGYLREQLGGVLMTEDLGQERIFKGGLAFSLDGQLLYDKGPGPFPHNVGGLAVNAQGGVSTSTLTPETFLVAIGLRNNGAMTEEHQPAGLFNEFLFQGLGYDFQNFRRATEALQFDAGVWKVIPVDFPRFEEGMLLMEPSTLNKSAIHNYEPHPDLSGIRGDVFKSWVPAPGLISRAGLTRVCPAEQVIELTAFPGGANVEIDGFTNEITPHAGSVFLHTFGGDVSFGIGDNRGIFSSHELVRVVHKADRPRIDDTLTFVLAGSQRIQFVLTQLEESSFVTSPIRTAGTQVMRDRDSCRWEDPIGG